MLRHRLAILLNCFACSLTTSTKFDLNQQWHILIILMVFLLPTLSLSLSPPLQPFSIRLFLFVFFIYYVRHKLRKVTNIKCKCFDCHLLMYTYICVERERIYISLVTVNQKILLLRIFCWVVLLFSIWLLHASICLLVFFFSFFALYSILSIKQRVCFPFFSSSSSSQFWCCRRHHHHRLMSRTRSSHE